MLKFKETSFAQDFEEYFIKEFRNSRYARQYNYDKYVNNPEVKAGVEKIKYDCCIKFLSYNYSKKEVFFDNKGNYMSDCLNSNKSRYSSRSLKEIISSKSNGIYMTLYSLRHDEPFVNPEKNEPEFDWYRVFVELIGAPNDIKGFFEMLL